MNKNEFLDVLRQALNGEVNSNIIEQNIRYYDQYISTRSGAEQDRILGELGDPRLIAKTIIEAEKAATQKNRYTNDQNYQNHNYQNHNYQNQNYSSESNEDKSNKDYGRGKNLLFPNIRWYHKLLIAAIILFVLIVLIFVGRILFAFGLPILLILLLLSLFRKRS